MQIWILRVTSKYRAWFEPTYSEHHKTTSSRTTNLPQQFGLENELSKSETMWRLAPTNVEHLQSATKIYGEQKIVEDTHYLKLAVNM